MDPNASPTATPFQPVPPSETPVPSATFIPTETASPAPLPPTETSTPEPTIPPPSPLPASGRTQYTFYVNLAYANHSLTADETIRYVNTTGQTLYDVVLAVEPNRWSSCFYLNSLSQDGNALSSYNLDGQRLAITLAQPIQPGATSALALNFSLSLPYKRYDDTFGYVSSQADLTDWYPFVVPYSGGWVLHDPWSFGEHLVYDTADYEVNIKVDDSTVTIAASGLGEPNGEWTRYRLAAARAFVFSASDRYLVEESAVGPTVIRSYYLAGHEYAGEAALKTAKQSVALYGVKFAPYPYSSLSVVETDVPDGREFDGLVFLASKFYGEYNGTGKSNLVTIGTHEIAHQWWFGLVGSDQALEPWLDEALATYSERIFYEYNYPRYGDWWWNYRVNYFAPTGWVDTNIYNGGTFRVYTNAVYLNGANFLEKLRIRIGDQAFFDFLQDYAARYVHGRATTYDFFAVLRQHTNADISDLIQTYFQNQY